MDDSIASPGTWNELGIGDPKVATHVVGQNCKRTEFAENYLGRMARSESNTSCVLWLDSPMARDSRFPDGTPKEALNYCRNPDRRVFGPWCYTDSETWQKEYCYIPYCSKYHLPIVVIRSIIIVVELMKLCNGNYFFEKYPHAEECHQRHPVTLWSR